MKIVIVGAGVAGLAIGLKLVQEGQEVTVLERAQPGQGATWASAGMLAVTSEFLDSGPAEVEFAQHANALWPEFTKDIEAKSARSIGYRQEGALLLVRDAPALNRLARVAENRSELEVVTAPRTREIASLVTGPVAGGLWSSKEARVDNRALGPALAVAFQKAGGELKTNEAVVRIDRAQNRAHVAHTPFGLYHADAFVLAAGAWSGLIEAELAPVVPVKGQIVYLVPPAAAEIPRCVIWGGGIYAVPRENGLMVGATAEEAGFDTAVTEEARNGLIHQAAKLMPDLQNWTVEDQWAGLRPKAPDGLPLLGPSGVEGLWLASGQYRNGILFAPAVAETMTGQILGKEKAIAAFDPRRFL